MTSFKLKQIGLALCLMASLLTASPAACTCSHHEETKALENDCHSHHETAETIETSVESDTVDVDCVCFVNLPSPSVISKSASKELRSNDAVSNAEQVITDLEFIAVTKLVLSSPEFGNNLSYSNTLKALLPARAPPRL